MAMFGVEVDSITSRRLNAYLRDTSNTLALESVLQLLGVPTELALVPTTGFDVASISTARVFGNEDEGFTQPADAAETADVSKGTFSEEDEEVAPYPGGYTSPLDRSYRLVATGRRVTLAEWTDAINNAHIPYEYTHLGSPEGSESDSFVETEEGYLTLDSALHEADSAVDEGYGIVSQEVMVSQQDFEGSAGLVPQKNAVVSERNEPNAPQMSASQSSAPQGSFVQSLVPRSRCKRLTPEQIRAKTRRVGIALSIDVTAQSAIALILANVARRRRAQGKASRKFSGGCALFALNATVESALIPTVLRSFEQTQMKKHPARWRMLSWCIRVTPQGSSPRPRSALWIDDLREGPLPHGGRMPPRPRSRHPLDCVSVPWV